MNNILDREQIENDIKKMLVNYESNCQNIHFKKGIYLYGSPGCGKTHFITEILKALNYDIIKYDAGDVRNKSLIDTITSNNISSQNVLNMMARKTKKIAIIMDEIDGMNNGDKGGITALIKLIRQKKTKKQRLEHMTMNPVICIGNYYIDKKIKELMKVCNTYELKPPTQEQIQQIIYKKIPDFSNFDKSTHKKILEYIQGDLRKIEFIEKICKKNPSLLNDDSMEHIFHIKQFNEDSKKITQKLIYNQVSINDHIKIINETDRTIVALLWHENIVDVLSKVENEISIPFYLQILDNICFADFIDRITFQNQIWQFNEMSSLMKTFYNNYLYHKTFHSHSHSHSHSHCSENKKDEIRFTKVLTKYSTEYNNILFIYNLCQELDMDKKDLLAFFQEIRLFHGKDFLSQNEKINAVEQMFDNYNIDKLDIKRIYRYLDKNVKKDIVSEEESDIDE